MKGRGTSSFRGPTSLRSAAGPPQEPPEDNAPPAQRGRRRHLAAVLFLACEGRPSYFVDLHEPGLSHSRFPLRGASPARSHAARHQHASPPWPLASTPASPPAAQAPRSNAAAFLLHQRPPPRSLASPDFAHATTACRSHSPRHLARMPRLTSAPPARARDARPAPRQRPCHECWAVASPAGPGGASSRRSARLGRQPL